jgi:hypothetical protein
MMKRAVLNGVGVLTAILAASAPALAFQELPEAPAPEVSYGSPEPSTPSAAVQSPVTLATENRGVLNLGILPKLDIGLELLYGNNQEAEVQDPMADESGDVTVLGKVKRRF